MLICSFDICYHSFLMQFWMLLSVSSGPMNLSRPTCWFGVLVLIFFSLDSIFCTYFDPVPEPLGISQYDFISNKRFMWHHSTHLALQEALQHCTMSARTIWENILICSEKYLQIFLFSSLPLYDLSALLQEFNLAPALLLKKIRDGIITYERTSHPSNTNLIL